METVEEDKYLGDIISSDGRNTKNIADRISKGIGKISQIEQFLDMVSLGEHLSKYLYCSENQCFLMEFQ